MTNKTASNLDLYFSGTVVQKIKSAKDIHRRYGPELLQNKNIGTALLHLCEHEKTLNKEMNDMHMGDRCTACAAKYGGCCSSYMADNTDAILILINMLMGINVIYNHNSETCCFIGDNGCILTIKPIFCLNYNCPQIRENYHTGQMLQLETLTAQLLGRQIVLENLLLELL